MTRAAMDDREGEGEGRVIALSICFSDRGALRNLMNSITKSRFTKRGRRNQASGDALQVNMIVLEANVVHFPLIVH